MNKYGINDSVYCLLNHEVVNVIVKGVSWQFDQLLYEVELDGLKFDVYEYEIGKTKEELKTEIENKIQQLQGVLDSIN